MAKGDRGARGRRARGKGGRDHGPVHGSPSRCVLRESASNLRQGVAGRRRAGVGGYAWLCLRMHVPVWAAFAMRPTCTGTTCRPISRATCLSTYRPVFAQLQLLYCDTHPAIAARANQPDAPGLTCRPSLVGTHPSVHALRSVTCPKPLREPMHRLLASCLFALASHTLPFPRLPLLSSPLLCRPSSLPSAPHFPLYFQLAKATSRPLARPSTAAKPRRGRRL